jgi:hypothetical protein
MIIDLIGGSYQHKYKNFNSQRTINFYPVPSTAEEKNKTMVALFPTPGLDLYSSIPGRYNRGIWVTQVHGLSNRCFTVVDDKLYELTNNGSVVILRGSLTNIGTGSTKVWMVANANNQLGIFHYNASYVLDLSTNILTQITSVQFPNHVTSVAFTDGYTFITADDAVYFCTSNDMLNNWSSLNVYSPTSRPAPTIAVTTFKEQTFNFTSETIETYYNDGSTPWIRLPRSTVFVGLVAPETLSTWNDGFMFLGREKDGEAQIYYYDGQSCVPVSPFSITWNINKSNSLRDSYSFMQHTKDGHVLYYLTVPDLNTTFVYDVQTKIWHERQSTQPMQDSNGDFVYSKFRGRHSCNFNGVNLFADVYSGNVFKENYSSFTENNNVIIRSRISKTFGQEKAQIDVSSVEFDFNSGQAVLSGQGSVPRLMFKYSKDNGLSFSSERLIVLGQTGKFLERARIRKLGTARQWTIAIAISDPIDFMVQEAVAHGSIGQD